MNSYRNMPGAVLAAVIALIALIAAAPVGAQTAVDGLDVPITDGAVDKIMVDDDGRIMMGGEFTVGAATRALIMRSRPDGRRDLLFSLNFAPSQGGIRGMVQVPNAGYLVGGDFSGAGYNSNLALLNGAGSPVAGFNLNVNGTVRVVERTSDDPATVQYYIGGAFTAVAGANRHRIARLNTNRNLDTGFQPPLFEGQVNAIHPLPDGKVLVGGSFLSVDGAPQAGYAMFRLNSNGSLDNSFVFDAVPNGSLQYVSAIAVQPDGRILIAGELAASAGGQTRVDIVRLMPNGSVDLSFETASVPNGVTFDLALQPDGRIVVVGLFTTLGLSNHIARLNADGSVDNGFALFMDPNEAPRTVAVQGDGGVLFAGAFSDVTGVPVNRVARVRKELGLDLGLDGSATGSSNGSVISTAVDAGGNLFIGGTFTVVQDQPRTYLARLAGISGDVSTNYTPTLNGPVHAVMVQTDGKLVIGGEFTLVNGSQRRRLARLNSDGTLDTGFLPATLDNGIVYALAQAPDGKIYIGGSFDDVGGSGRDHFARLNANGSLDTGFNDTGVDDTVRVIALEWDQYRIYIGGDFEMVGGYHRPRLARVWPHGTINNGFNAGDRTWSVISLAPTPFNRVLVGSNSSEHRLEHLQESGTALPGFWTGVINGSVTSIVRDQTGSIYIGGGFSSIDGTSRLRLARLVSYGAVDTTFADTPVSFGILPTPGVVRSLLLQGNGKLVVAGSFSQVGGEVRRNVARISNRSGIIDERLVVEGDGSVTWSREQDGPQVRSAPELLMSTTCCSPGDFEPVPGTMDWDPATTDWVYDAFPNLHGHYYLKTRARIGGTGGGVMESPIHQFYGGAEPEEEAELGIQMEADPLQANVGDAVTFQLTVTNSGPDPAAQVEVEALLPSGFAYEDHDLSQGSYDPLTGLWTIGGLAPKGPSGEASLKITATVAAAGPYEFQAKVQSEAFDPFSGNNIASVVVTVLPPVDDTIFAHGFE